MSADQIQKPPFLCLKIHARIIKACQFVVFLFLYSNVRMYHRKRELRKKWFYTVVPPWSTALTWFQEPKLQLPCIVSEVPSLQLHSVTENTCFVLVRTQDVRCELDYR